MTEEVVRTEGTNRPDGGRTKHAYTGLIGAAGEYYVAAELSRRDWLATVTVKNAPGTDVLAKDPHSGWAVSIQTKTTTGGRSFLLSAKDELPARGDNEWYVLVRLPDVLEQRPDFYVVPRHEIAWMCRQRGERIRLKREGRDSGMRTISRHDLAAWEDEWDLLGTPTSQLPSRDPGLIAIESTTRGGVK